MSIVVDNPHDVSSILFQKKKDLSQSVQAYVGPIQVSNDENKVVHGRGVVATRDIAAGELLMVTPPTVDTSLHKVHQYWSTRHKENPKQPCLENCAEEILLQAMESACQDNPAVAVSFAVLAGADQHDIETSVPPISVLLGHREDNDDSNIDIGNLTRNDLLKIIRANAFGPDGVHSYANVEEQWLAVLNRRRKTDQITNTSDLLRETPRLLGIYPLAAMLNHSFQANAVRVYAGNVMVVHAMMNIPEGTEIVWSYVPPSEPDRQHILSKQHGFTISSNDDLPVQKWKSHSPPEWQKWNQRQLVALPTYPQLNKCVNDLEQSLTEATELSNAHRRTTRISYLYLYIHYLNVALGSIMNETDPLVANVLRTDLLSLCTHLHFSFCDAHNASTEHLSVR
jgi:hypothetical protein